MSIFIRLQILSIISVLVLALASSNALASGGRACSSIFRYSLGLSEVVKKNRFDTGRDLIEYILGFHKDFAVSLGRLKAADTWIDLGAGKGRAAESYLNMPGILSQKANVLLIAYRMDRFFKIPNYRGKLEVLEGKLLEEISLTEIPKAKLMTDFFGVISYTRDLSRALSMIFDRLERGGELFIHSSNPMTVIEVEGQPISLTTYLAAIPGLKVEGNFGRLKITKVDHDIFLPSLKLTHLDEGTEGLPFRRFELAN